MELHIIFGPTASSKTKMAQALWEQYHYPILSVDSRKVYKGADIGTNKYTMLKFLKENPEILVGGLDFLEPNQDVSVFIYQSYVYNWIADHEIEIKDAGGLIIHGGTGLYLDAILDGSSLLSKRNDELRQRLNEYDVSTLQQLADKADPQKFSALNGSDRRNSRRLIRVIENSLDDGHVNENTNNDQFQKGKEFFANAIKIWHLDIPEREKLYETINERVWKYFSEGWMEEIVTLLAKYGPQTQALRMMGYRELGTFIQEHANWEQLVLERNPEFVTVVENIQKEHRHYAKRQETWAKKYITL